MSLSDGRNRVHQQQKHKTMKAISFLPFENCFGRQTSLALARLCYSHGGNLAVMAYEASDGELEPYATLTVNLPDYSFLLGENQAFIDANNHPWALNWLEENGIARHTGLYASSGFCQYPLMTFDPQRLNTPEEFRQAGFID